MVGPLDPGAWIDRPNRRLVLRNDGQHSAAPPAPPQRCDPAPPSTVLDTRVGSYSSSASHALSQSPAVTHGSDSTAPAEADPHWAAPKHLAVAESRPRRAALLTATSV